MPVIKNKSTEQNREFWHHVESVSRELDAWLPRKQRKEKPQECRKSNAAPDDDRQPEDLRQPDE